MISFRHILVAALALALLVPASAGAVPREFFGISPQTTLRPADTVRMRQARIGSVRIPILWGDVQPNPEDSYNWSGLDEVIAVTARDGLRVLPFVYGTPSWLSGRGTVLPVDNARQRRAWVAFLQEAVERYGPGGEFWQEHGRSSKDFVPPLPVTAWQIWNEENFFYFATPASPGRYARLLKLSHRAIASRDRRAKVIVGGLFGDPGQGYPLGMDASIFLDRLYRVRGIKASFDGVALHPYARDVAVLRQLTEGVRRILVRNRDRRTGLYVTELGWGSKRNPRLVAFEVGLHEQARRLRGAYRYLIGNRHRLNLEQVYWYSWKDASGDLCAFCDSVGLFRRGQAFRPKPAWHAFRAVTHGRLR
ncbi:MAG TPA: hypothetical protein VIT85_00515 [Solirubrobacterales bacterium]